jgi:hypothetical protein
VIFAQKRKRVLLNHEAYSFLTEYKKIFFRITPQTEDLGSMIVVDQLPLNLANTKVDFGNKLLLMTTTMPNTIEYDKSVIFCKNSQIDPHLFHNPIVIEREDFLSLQNNARSSVERIVFGAFGVLFLLMVALVRSFVTRNYKLYKRSFEILHFYGYDFKIVSLVLGFVMLISGAIATLILEYLIGKINAIFDLYYVDLIFLAIDYTSLVVFFVAGLSIAYLYEARALNKINKKGKMQ